MTINTLHFWQFFSGSGQILQPGQLYLSPGLAKIAPWWLAAGTVSRLKYRMTHRRAAPPTLSAHTRWPLASILKMRQIFLLTVFFSTQIFAQHSPSKCLWADTNFISVKLHDSRKDKKIVMVDIGQKATIYLKAKQLRKCAVKITNDYNKKKLSAIINLIDSASKTSDTILIDQFLTDFDFLVSIQLQKGDAKVFYKKVKLFIPTISHRQEKYGMYAYRFFYFPDKRPFFSTMELSGIIEDNKFYSDKNDLVKLGEKLAGLRKE